MTTYQFMQQMTRLAYNRRRAAMGLPPVSATPKERSAPNEQAEASGGKKEDE